MPLISQETFSFLKKLVLNTVSVVTFIVVVSFMVTGIVHGTVYSIVSISEFYIGVIEASQLKNITPHVQQVDALITNVNVVWPSVDRHTVYLALRGGEKPVKLAWPLGFAPPAVGDVVPVLCVMKDDTCVKITKVSEQHLLPKEWRKEVVGDARENQDEESSFHRYAKRLRKDAFHKSINF